MKVKLHFLFIMMVLLSACTSDRFLADKRAHLMSRDNPPAYIDGYMDGCASGRRMGGDKHFAYSKDAARMEREALYARGWHEGQINCRNETLSEIEQRQYGKKSTSFSSSIDAERQRRMEAEGRASEKEMTEMWEELRK